MAKFQAVFSHWLVSLIVFTFTVFAVLIITKSIVAATVPDTGMFAGFKNVITKA